MLWGFTPSEGTLDIKKQTFRTAFSYDTSYENVKYSACVAEETKYRRNTRELQRNICSGIIYKMDDFYFYACVIALIILIVLLTLIGIAISASKQLIIYPPTFKNCPDYWTEGDGTEGNAKPGYCLYPTEISYRNRGNMEFQDNVNKKLPNVSDIGNLHALSFMAYDTGNNAIPTAIMDEAIRLPESASKFYIKMNENDASWNTIYGNAYVGKTVRCAKRQWANENGIVWDGITNYNGCT